MPTFTLVDLTNGKHIAQCESVSERGAKSKFTRMLTFVNWNLHAVWEVEPELKQAIAHKELVDTLQKICDKPKPVKKFMLTCQRSGMFKVEYATSAEEAFKKTAWYDSKNCSFNIDEDGKTTMFLEVYGRCLTFTSKELEI